MRKIICKCRLLALVSLFITTTSIAEVSNPSPPRTEVTPAPFIPRTEAEAGVSHEDLTNNFPSWRSHYIEGVHYYAPRETVYGAFREVDRSGHVDHEAQASVYHPVGPASTLLLDATYSSSHITLPRWSMFAQWEHSFWDGWGVLAGMRRREYTDNRVNIGNLTAERYIGNYHVAYTLFRSDVQRAGSETSHLLQATYYYGERNSVGLVYTNGRELEFDAASQSTLVFDIRALAVTGRHWVTRGWAVSYSVYEHEQGNAYTRKGVNLGIRHAF